MDLDLLEKTELWIKNVEMKEVDLNLIATKIADVLNLKHEEVIVVDVRVGVITIDILRKTVKAEDIFGKKEAIIQALSNVPGLTLTKKTAIHSEGILGMIDLDEAEAHEVLKKSEKMGEEILKKIRKRVIVFSTGFEIKQGLIKDTNTPYIVERLSREGFDVKVGAVLDDDKEDIAFILHNALNSGFGLIITTGGVGAEDKDKTIEGLLIVDPKGSTPYLTRYSKGTGRHDKDGVKIGVGRVGESTIVALPGPNDEVKLAMELVIEGIKEGWDKWVLAERIASRLRVRLRDYSHNTQ